MDNKLVQIQMYFSLMKVKNEIWSMF